MPASAAAAELTSLAKILDLANVIIHDVDGRISYWTTGCERLYGWSREEALGQVVHDLLKTEYPLPRSKIVAKLRKEGSWQGEIEHQKKGCGANAGDRRKKALGSLTRITRQALHSKSQARFCF